MLESNSRCKTSAEDAANGYYYCGCILYSQNNTLITLQQMFYNKGSFECNCTSGYVVNSGLTCDGKTTGISTVCWQANPSYRPSRWILAWPSSLSTKHSLISSQNCSTNSSIHHPSPYRTLVNPSWNYASWIILNMNTVHTYKCTNIQYC